MSPTKPSTFGCIANGLSLKSKLFFTGISVMAKFAFHPDGTVNRRLVDLADIRSPPSSIPINGVVSYDHTIDSSRNLWFRLFHPTNPLSYPSLPVILYFHGGGFVSFSPAALPFDTLCRKVSGDLSAVVISVAYRHSPEHRWPAQYNDGLDILRFLDNDEMREKFKDFNIPANANLSRCFLAGDSAGGNIAHNVAVRACGSGAQFKTVRIGGIIGIQPFFGGKERTESELQKKNNGMLLNLDCTDFYWKAFLPDGSDRDHPGANVFGPNSTGFSGLDRFPPAFVAVGGLDILQDWQRRYCDELKRLGKEVELVEYPNVGHGFYAAPELPETQMLVDKVKMFVQKQLRLST